MADEATWVTGTGASQVTIGFFRWIGDLRPDLMSIYGMSDQDGTLGGKAYLVDNKPRLLDVVVWGSGDIAAQDNTGILAKLKANKDKIGKLTFYDGFVADNVKLMNVRFLRPIGIGRDSGTEVFSEIETIWLIQG